MLSRNHFYKTRVCDLLNVSDFLESFIFLAELDMPSERSFFSLIFTLEFWRDALD
jgi:ABC-type protease/lipase transport system fused ATPase/permease subunit